MARHFSKPKAMYTIVHSLTTLLRFALIAPTIYYWGYATRHHTLVSDNILLHNGTYNPAIATGERLANRSGLHVLFWNTFIWLPSSILLPPLHLPIVVGDALVTGYLSRATAYQSEYAPKDLKACRHMSKFYDQRPLGTNESFFAAAARLNETVTTPTEMCKNFVREWQYGVALSFFYALLSLVGIVSFIGCIALAKQRILEVYIITKGSGKLAILLTIHLCSIPTYIFRGCLPMKAKAPVRTARRYAVKTVLGVEQKTELALKQLKTESFSRNTVGRYKGAQGESTPLGQFLGVYDILVMVVPYLHYVDAVNLASVSKSVRNSVLPPDDLYRRLALFKTLTCSDAYRVPCWVCSGQTCTDCYKLASVTLTNVIHHLENCKPYCRSCYYQHIALKPPSYWARRKHTACECAPMSVHAPNLYKRFVFVRSRERTTRVPRSGERPVCGTCSILTSEEMTLRKSKSGKIRLKKGQNGHGQKWDTCAKADCGKRLDSGPRFWICTGTYCGRECTSHLHQAWGTDSKGAEDAV